MPNHDDFPKLIKAAVAGYMQAYSDHLLGEAKKMDATHNTAFVQGIRWVAADAQIRSAEL